MVSGSREEDRERKKVEGTRRWMEEEEEGPKKTKDREDDDVLDDVLEMTASWETNEGTTEEKG